MHEPFRPASEVREFVLGSVGKCTLRKSKRAKHLNLKISPSGMVELVIPTACTFAQAEWFLQSQQAWLVRQMDILHAAKQQHPELYEAIPQLLRLRALEQIWQLKYQVGPSARNRASTVGFCLYIYARNLAGVQQCLHRWLNRVARDYLGCQLSLLSRQCNLPYARLSIRNQKTRWGSCSHSKNISLNRNIVFLPTYLARYICIHELCHTIYLNHSQRYWQLVKNFAPTYRELEKQLHKTCHYVPIWALEKTTPA